MGKYNIVVVLLCNSGKANAAGATASLRSSYPCVELLLLTGICECVPDANGGELLLDDVIISETVIQYDLGTQHVAGFKEKDTLEDRHGRANKNIRNFIANVKTGIGYQRIEEKAAAFLEQIQSRTSEAKYQRRHRATTYTYPGSANDILFESTHCHRHYNSSECVCADYNPDEDFYAVSRARVNQKSQLESRGDLKSAQIPSIFPGRFGPGDTTFRSGIHRDSLAKKHNIMAFEMEGAGVWDELPCIIIKGVSEYGDGHKAQKNWIEWHNFAAATAASVARALVERYPQTDKSPAVALKLLENKACQNALFITNPEDDKRRIEETKGGLHLDAYIWIIQNEEFTHWLKDPETRLLTNARGDVYYFLCQATDHRLHNASAILRGLLYMMVVQQPSLIPHVRQEYDKSGKSAFEGVNSWVVLSRIFEQMLRDGLLKESIFIIDAPDECVADLEQLLKMIVRSSTSSSQAKWLVSKLNPESISSAISTYIRHKAQVLENRKVCASLEKAPRSDPLPKSVDFPPGLDRLYERMISKVCDLNIPDIGKKVLAIATVAYRPLTNEESLWLASNKEGNKRLFSKGVEYTHIEIFKGSIAVMSNILRRDMYSLIDPVFSMENISQHSLSADPLIPMKYGCVYWIDHFEQSISKAITGIQDSSKSHELIQVFLKEKYIYWLEALRLLSSMSDGIARMQRLEQLVAKTEAPGILEFVRDACKFIQSFGNAIADYPLQVYVSALIFSPTQSITRHQFKTEAPKWIRTVVQSEAKWASSLRTYECSDSIFNIAVSCCGTWIAETYSGKKFRHLSILSEASTFTDNIKSNQCHYLTPLSFSPWDRKELVSSNRGLTGCVSQLVVWDITRGKVSQQLRVEERGTSISYLSAARNILVYLSYIPENDKKSDYPTDGRQTLIASIWNTKAGQSQILKKILLQKPSSVVSLPMFTDHIAWHRGSDVEVINLHTGSVVLILKDFERGVANMDVSPDGSFLVLQRKTNKPLNTCDLILLDISRAWGLTFSPDGKLVAFATSEGIELLSTISGKCLRKIMNRCFLSPNSTFVASGFEDRQVIKVMELGSTNSTRFLRIPDLMSRRIPELLFSPDSKHLVAITVSAFILWDISSQNAKIMLMGETISHPKPAFQSDSERLAIVTLMRLEKKLNTRILPQICYSSNNERLAISYADEDYTNEYYTDRRRILRVEIWDIGSISPI
ncbi:hypothetical protein V8C34DRAFT_323384 [Trichoderma compactum]